jgi:hypothetical protein
MTTTTADDQVRYLGSHGDHGHTRELPRDLGRRVWVRCVNGDTVRLDKVDGRYSPDHPCDSRCMGARGSDCVCGCGGRNHGRGWATTGAERIGTEAIEDRPDVAAAFAWADTQTDLAEVNPFVADLTDRLAWGLSLTTAQADAYVRSVDKTRTRLAERADESPQVDAPAGRQTITGTVLNTKWQDGGDYPDTFKMLVKVETGNGHYRVWATVPSALTGWQDGRHLTVDRGDTVTLTVTLQPKEPGFAFGSRPTAKAPTKAA